MSLETFGRRLMSGAGHAVRRERAIVRLVAAATFVALISVAFGALNRSHAPAPRTAKAAPPQDALVDVKEEVLPGSPATGFAVPADPADDDIWPPRESFAEVQPQSASLNATTSPSRLEPRMNTGLARAPERDADETPADDSVAERPLKTSRGAPTECLPDALKSVLRDLDARFRGVELVSTTHLHTDNHSRGSARARMHGDCRAVDIKSKASPHEVIAFLKKAHAEFAPEGHTEAI